MRPQISLSCLLVLEGQMNERAGMSESGEHHKIPEQMAPLSIAQPRTPGKESNAPYPARPHKSDATSAQVQMRMVGRCGAISPRDEGVRPAERLLWQ